MSLSSFFWRFEGTDPWTNLAREEFLLDALPEEGSALVLYVNSPCIVMGKHQNPLREVRLAEAARRGVPMLRRASGGGTVWHDEGNLNWSFLLPKAGYDRAAVSRRVADALKPLGVVLQTGEKGDLFHEEKKVSGAAYLFRRDRVLHHGTLLCQARLDDLRGVLGPTGTLSQWVGVASRPMPVKNLGIRVADAEAALSAAWGSSQKPPLPEDFDAKVRSRAEELRGEGWLWDQTPPFTWEGLGPEGPLRAQVRDGLIEAAWDDRNQILGNMVGKRFFTSEFLLREGA